MKSIKNHSRLWLMILALVACTTLVVGNTIAWFTDEVTTTGNIVKAGVLDVEMHWADGTSSVPVNDGWLDASEGAIFDYALWEPGYTQVRHLRVANVGDLALSYHLRIKAGGTVSELAEVIDVYSMEPARRIKSRTELTDEYKVGTLVDVLAGNNTVSGGLLPGESCTLTLALKMREEAGNEYQNLTIDSDFAVVLEATQLPYEEDSFNNLYDADASGWSGVAEMPTVENGVAKVYTAEQLAGVMANLTADITTIELMEDIDLSGRSWTPAKLNGQNGKALQLIYGNGHTISNLTVTGADQTGFIGSNLRSYTIKDLTFKNSKVEGDRFTAVVIGYMYGHVVMENVDVVDSSVTARSSVATKGIRVGALVGFVPPDGGSLKLDGCDVSGSTISGYHNVGAMVGTSYYDKTTAVNCTASNNTILYSSPQVGGFAFGAGNSGYQEYKPSGFTASNNTIRQQYDTQDVIDKAIADGATSITLAPGSEVTMPANLQQVSEINANGAKVTFGGSIASDLTVNDAVVVSQVKIGSSVNVTFEGCDFVAENAINYTYCKNAVFKDCVFNCATKAIHFDVVGESLLVQNCVFEKGRVQIGGYAGAAAKFEDCIFGSTDQTSIWSEKGTRYYIPTEFIGCEFNNRVVLAGSNGLALSFDGCTMNGGNPVDQSIIMGGNVPNVTIK